MERDRRERPKGVETPGQRYGRLIRQAVEHTVALDDTKHDPASVAHTQAKDGLAMVHDEFRSRCLHGNGYDAMLQTLFEDRVVTRVLGVFQDRRDAKRAESVGQVLAERAAVEPDYELQARTGEIPVHRSDAGFPAPPQRRRGW